MRSAALVRPYGVSDRDALYEICVRTGMAGADARGRLLDDALLGDLYCGPYLELEPGLVSVLEHNGRPAGYVLGAADTAAFVTRYRERWLPGFVERYAAALDDPAVKVGLSPERMLVPELAEYPAHLHIDLLPQTQGSGAGRRLIEAFCTAAAARGAEGVHLAVDPVNTNAIAFYRHLGFEPLASSTAVEPRLGLRL